MKPVYLRFLKNLLIFSLVIAGLLSGLSFIVPRTFFSPSLPFLFLFFVGTTLVSFYLMLRFLQKKFTKFVQFFLLTTGCKLLWYLGIMILYVFLCLADAVTFILDFFLLYLSYTVFETVAIVNYSRNCSGNKPSTTS